MESKIEKIEVNSFTDVNDGVYLIIQKINEFIDYLNSQSQPEEMLDSKEAIKNIVRNVTGKGGIVDSKIEYPKHYPENITGMKDTPEEWEEELLDLEVSDDWTVRRSLRNTVDKEGARLIVDFIKQLLEERKREVFTKEEWGLMYESLIYRFGNDKEFKHLEQKILGMRKLSKLKDNK